MDAAVKAAAVGEVNLDIAGSADDVFVGYNQAVGGYEKARSAAIADVNANYAGLDALYHFGEG